MFHSNLSVGEVDGILASLFKSSERVVIASGYFGLSQVKKYRPDFANILKKHGVTHVVDYEHHNGPVTLKNYLRGFK